MGYGTDLLKKAKEQSAPKYEGKTLQYWDDLIPQEGGATADFTTMMKASLVDDPQTKLGIYAGGMFPNDPNATNRMGMFGDEPYYVQGNKKVFATDQGLWGGTKQLGADLIGKLPTEILAGTGAVLGSALGPAGAVGGAMLGAAGGEGYRKVMGNLLFGEPQTPMGNMADMGIEAGLAGTGGLVGETINAVLNRNVARDISRLNTGQVDDITQKAAQKNIYLTPAEATNLQSLKSQQKMIGQMTETADQMDDMYLRRAGEVEDAVNRELDNISPISSPEVAGAKARQASERVYTDIEKARSAAARPFYDQATQAGPYDISDVLSEVDGLIPTYPEGGKIRKGLTKVRQLLTQTTDDGSVPVMDFDMLNNAKQEIDDLIGAAYPKKKNLGRVLTNAKNRLLEIMDDQEPAYGLARKIWKEGADEIDRLDGELVKVMTGIKDSDLQKKAITLLNPTTRSPESIFRLRNMVMKKDPDAWNGIVRAYLQDAWEKAGKRFASTGENFNRGAKFSAAIFGDKKRDNILKAALSGDQYKSLKDLAQVLDATGRVKRIGSDTAWNQAMQREFKDEATGIIPKMLSPLDTLSDWLVNSRMDKRAKQIADIITDPNSRATLRELRKLDPASEKFIIGLSTLLGSTSTVSVNPMEEKSITPPVLRQLNER